MTDNEINLTLCEIRGWKPTNEGLVHPSGDRGMAFPDHLHGIEALGNLHECEKLLTEDQYQEFKCCLSDDVHALLRDMISASPKSRAESILRATGRWVES